jgi:hypothetical protein
MLAPATDITVDTVDTAAVRADGQGATGAGTSCRARWPLTISPLPTASRAVSPVTLRGRRRAAKMRLRQPSQGAVPRLEAVVDERCSLLEY